MLYIYFTFIASTVGTNLLTSWSEGEEASRWEGSRAHAPPGIFFFKNTALLKVTVLISFF